jgi:hypothetical protein
MPRSNNKSVLVWIDNWVFPPLANASLDTTRIAPNIDLGWLERILPHTGKGGATAWLEQPSSLLWLFLFSISSLQSPTQEFWWDHATSGQRKAGGPLASCWYWRSTPTAARNCKIPGLELTCQVYGARSRKFEKLNRATWAWWSTTTKVSLMTSKAPGWMERS